MPSYYQLTRPPSLRELRRLHRAKPPVLVLRGSGDWSRCDLSFLSECGDTSELRVVGAAFRDLSGLHVLKKLRVLRLYASANCRLDLGCMPSLRDVEIQWNKGYTGLAACARLRRLHIHRPSTDAIVDMSSLGWLNDLELVNVQGERPFRRLWRMTGLRRLRIALATRLCSQHLNGIAALSKLRSLSLEACGRLKSLTALAGCRTLEELNVEGCPSIASLKPLGALRRLRGLWIGGSDIADGDLSVVPKLPRLVSFAAPNRRYFRPSARETTALIEARGARRHL